MKFRSLRARGAALALTASMLLGVAACGGDDGAGAAVGTTPPATQASPSTGSGGAAAGATSVIVSGASPASGNATVSGSAGTASVISGTNRRLIAEGIGSGNGLVHRFTVDFDGATGVVSGVTHSWGASAASFDAITQCVRTATVVGQASCGNGVAVDVAVGRASFNNAVLRGSGTFASILNGQINFTTP